MLGQRIRMFLERGCHKARNRRPRGFAGVLRESPGVARKTHAGD
jgi:hypothetical protein